MAFLIAGPATNVTTFGVLAKLHGRRVALLFGVAVTVLAVLAGWTIDLVGVQAAPILESHQALEAHGSGPAYIAVAGPWRCSSLLYSDRVPGVRSDRFSSPFTFIEPGTICDKLGPLFHAA